MSQAAALIVCDNPAVLMHDSSGSLSAFVSAWRVWWSPMGTGAVVFWHDGHRLVAFHEAGGEALATWIHHQVVRHVGELEAVDSDRLTLHQAHIAMEIGPRGAEARVSGAGERMVSWLSPGPPVICDYDDVALGTGRFRLRNCTAECTGARVSTDGQDVSGTLTRAFIAVAETWVRTD